MNLAPVRQVVAALRFDNCFNPYVDRCEIHDRHDAPNCRATALSAMLRGATQADRRNLDWAGSWISGWTADRPCAHR